MTKEEAKWRLADHFRVHDDGRPTPKLDEAVAVMFKALEKPEQKWIPVSERLPGNTNNEYYPMSLVTLDNGDVCLGVYRYDDKEWWTRMSEGETGYTKDHKVIAWQPLPEPYKER